MKQTLDITMIAEQLGLSKTEFVRFLDSELGSYLRPYEYEPDDCGTALSA